MNRGQYHSMFFGAVLDHAKEHLEPWQLTAALKRAELTIAELRNPRGWIDAERAEALFDAIVEESENPNFFIEVGRRFMTGPYNRVMRALLRAFGAYPSPTMWAALPTIARRWNTTGRYEMEIIKDGFVRFAWCTAIENSVHSCHGRLSQIIWFYPGFYGISPAQVDHPVCRHVDGGDRCIYEVRWVPRRTNLRRTLAAGGVGLAMGGFTWAVSLSLTSIPVVLGLLFVAMGLGVGLVIARLLRVEAQLHQQSKDMLDQNLVLQEGLDAERQRIMELKTAMEQLVVAAERAERANAVKDAFFDGATRELQLPLSEAIWHLQELADTSPPASFNKVSDRLARVSQLVDERLRHADAQSELSFEWRILEIAPLVQGVVARFANDLKAKGLKTTMTLEAVEGHKMWTDKERLQLVLANLLDNAVKFSTQGRINIEATLSDDEEEVRFVITDQGIGLAPNTLDKAFELFFVADDSPSRSVLGAGVGLTHSRALAEAMYGSLTLNSDGLGKGATAVLRLPVN